MGLYEELTKSDSATKKTTQNIKTTPKSTSLYEELTGENKNSSTNLKATSKKTLGSTLGYIGKEIGKSYLQFQEDIADTGAIALKGLGTATSWLANNKVGKAVFGKDAGDKKNNPLYQIGSDMLNQDVAQTIAKPLDKKFNDSSYIKPDSFLGKLPAVGGQVLGLVKNPIGGLKSSAISSFGSGYKQAGQITNNEIKKLGYGALNSGIQTGTELLFGGLGKAFGKGALDDVLISKLTTNIKGKVLKSLAEMGLKSVGEGTEELLADVFTPIAQKITYLDKETLSKLYKDQNFLQDFLSGAIVSGITQLPSTITNAKTNNITTKTTTPQTQLQTPTQTNIQDNAITPTTQQTTQEVVANKPKEQAEDISPMNNYEKWAKSVSKNKNELANELLIKNYNYEYEAPKNENDIRLFHGTEFSNYDDLSLQDFNETTMDRNYGDYFYLTNDKGFAKIYGNNIAEFHIPKSKVLTLNEYREKFKGISDEELFKKYWALEMPDNEYIVKNIDEVKKYTKENVLNKISEEQPTTTPEVATQPETKQRGVFETALENQNIPTDIKTGIRNQDQNYMVITNEDLVNTAKKQIEQNGSDNSYITISTKFNNNQILSSDDIATATLLYNEAYAKGDTQKALDLLTTIAINGTKTGQASQATILLQKASPDGRLLAIQKQINQINEENKNKKSYKPLNITQEEMNKIKNSKSQNELDKSVNDTITRLSKEMPKTLGDRLKEWRYLAMLGNLKTHLRNITSNTAMKGVSKIKNTLSSALQDIFIKDISQKTQTLRKANKKTIDFVKEDVINQKGRIQGTDKYDQGKNIIKPIQSKLSVLNSNALEFEDWIFSSSAYKSALENYITAQNIDVDNTTPIEIEKARQYAIEQAQEQTFRTANKIAQAISQFENKNSLTKVLIGSTLPFKTTPINIAKTGLEYSPVGLIKTITKNTSDLKSGKIKPSQYIDNLSKGLTGSSIALIGYLLADMGILTASGSDEDKEKYFQEMQGKQPYSIQIGNKTITLDWLSPSAMPFFMGAEISEMKKNGMDTSKLINIASALGTIIDPLTELSMLQGLNKTLKSYEDNALGGVVTNTLQNYALQYIPTLSGQLARTFSPERKSTTGKGTGIEKQFNTFVNQVKAKIPVLINTLEPYTDQFGNKEITNSIAERAFQNFLSPAYLKTIKTEKVYDEIQKLYDKTGEESILPTSAQRYFTQNGKKIYLTPEEYTKFNTIDGQNSMRLLNNLVNDASYKNMSDTAKVKAIENFYRASQQIAKSKYNK